MKTSKIISTIFSFTLIFFMSVTSIANSNSGYTGDIIKSDIKKQIEGNKDTGTDVTTTENEFSNLRFDVKKFNSESETIELPMNSTGYLRFDVNTYSQGATSETTEMPAMNSTDYLRFNVNSFDKSDNISDMPVNEFEYLHFNVNHFDNTPGLSEMPAK